jgi:ABC-type multidrug transport system ATPase subunit/ABC-type multidrug transport system permease subunit
MDDDFEISLRPGPEPVEGVVLRRARTETAVLYGGRRIPLTDAGLTIGREAGCDLVLASGLVSPRHARIVRRKGRYELLDLDSRSGTYLNGERFIGEPRVLNAGDSIAVGDEILHFVTAGDLALPPVEIPTAPSALRMDRPRLAVGRAPESDILLDHPTVSPLHAEIVAGPSGVRIKDLSRGGTGVRVNGRLVTRSFLKTGDEIAIGPYRLVFDGALLQQRATRGGMRLDAEAVSVAVRGLTILQPTTLSVEPGEFVAVIGESGAGKSTLMKVLCGVHPPSAGRVMVDGEAVATRLTDLGYVPQDEIVHRALTVREALGYAAELRLPQDTPRTDREAAVERVIEEVGLTGYGDVRIGSLSGGQRKRAGVAVELIDEPALLFLDEPTTGLDPGLEQRMMRLFRALSDGGRALLLVTHATRSLRLCDKVVVMGRGGLLCFYGPPDAALEFFGVAHFDDLYGALEESGAEHWHAAFAGASSPHYPAADPGRPRRIAPYRRIGPQATTLTRRHARLLVRDRRNLRILAAQVPILGFATALLFKADVFERAGPMQAAGESAQLLFLLVIVATWFGVMVAAREIVKERSVVERELAVGVRVPAYIASKAALLFALTGAQTIVLALIVITLRPLHQPGAGSSIVILLVLTSWAGVGMGLVVSALVRSEDQASSFVPLLLIPQLLFGGAIVAVAQMGALMSALSNVIVARWAFAGVGNAMHMHERIDADPVFRTASRYGDGFFTLPPIGAGAGIVLFLVVCYLVLYRVLPAVTTRQD